MNQQAEVTVHGHAGVGVGREHDERHGAREGQREPVGRRHRHGGLLVIEGDASSRCGISMKGIDIVVGGSVGHMSGFMAQLGHLVVCGDAGEALGDSIYEAILYVRGSVESLGADCIEKDMTPGAPRHARRAAGPRRHEADPADFRRYGSARTLYHFDIDKADAY